MMHITSFTIIKHVSIFSVPMKELAITKDDIIRVIFIEDAVDRKAHRAGDTVDDHTAAGR